MIMKIILEETAEHLKGKRRVEIEWDQDDMDIYEFREKLLEPALLAWTYQPNTIAELFGDDDEELGDDNAYNTMYDFDDGNGLVSAHKHKKGGGWVADTAEVDEFVYVGIDATVYGNAKVSGNSQVYGNAKVFGNAELFDVVYVFGNSQVYGEAKVFGDAKVYGNAHVFGGAKVSGEARVYDDAVVYGNAKVYGNAHVCGNALVYEDAKIFNYKVTGKTN